MNRFGRTVLTAIAFSLFVFSAIGGAAATTQTASFPAAFVPNRGQTDPRVQFVAQTRGASFWFTCDEAVFSLRKGGRRADLALRFIGADPNVLMRGRERMKGSVNYLIGRDRSQWQTDLPMYGELVYRDLWPGIDLAFRDREGTLKYEFRVAPGADVSNIGLEYRGAERVSRGTHGELIISTAAGAITDAPPVSYQIVDGKRVLIASEYVVGEDGRYGFALGRYDVAQPLTIDPGLAYSTFLGGSGVDFVYGVAVDASGNAYIAGGTTSVDFPFAGGGLGSNAGGSVFVTKLNPTGTGVIWSTYLGGSGGDSAYGIAVDAAGSVHIAGITTSADFPTTIGAYDSSLAGQTDAFVARLQPSGNALIYSSYLGGSDDDAAIGMALDPAGNLYVTGWTSVLSGPPAPDFPLTPGAFDTGVGTSFLTKFSPTGALLYSTHLGLFFRPWGVAADGGGNAYVHGQAVQGFQATPGAYGTVMKGDQDIALMKLNATGSQLLYATLIPGSRPACPTVVCIPAPPEGDQSRGLSVDSAGNAYLTGTATAPDFPTTPGAFDTVRQIGSEGFVAKLNATGSALLYSTLINSAAPQGIALDSSGRAFVTGAAGPGMPVTADAVDSTVTGTPGALVIYDAFVVVLDPAGAALEYATYLGGSSGDSGFSIAVDGVGGVYVAGQTSSSDFPTTAGAFDTSYNGGEADGGLGDGFVAKIDLQLPSLFQSFAAKASTAGPTFEINGTFTLAAASDGIDPVTEQVRLEAGTTSYVVPAGSFRRDNQGRYKFESPSLHMLIALVIGRTYSIRAHGKGALSGNIVLSIGNDRGTAVP